MPNIFEFISGYFRFNLFGILNIIAGFFNFGLGLFILLCDPKSKINRSYFLISLSATIWVFGFGLSSLTRGHNDSYIWLRLAYIFGVPFISPMVCFFSRIWVNKPVNNPGTTISLILGSVFAAAWFIFHEEIFTIVDFGWGRYPYYTYTNLSIAYITSMLIFFWYFAILAFLNFYQGWKIEKDPIKKLQFRNILFGYLIAYTGAVDFLTSFTGKGYPFGFVSLSILTGIVAYTIVRHRFLEINITLRKITLIIVIYSALTGITILLSYAALKKILPNATDHSIFILFSLTCLMSFILSTGPLIYAYIIRNTYWLKTNMSIGITHELKSPISTIQGSLEILTEEIGKLKGKKKKTHEYLNLIDNNTHRLSNFVNNLITISDNQDSQIVLYKKRSSIINIIKTVISHYKLAASIKEINIRFSYDSIPHVNIDVDKIEQVVSNIISNALKYTYPKTLIMIDLRKKNKDVVCSISDQGPGVQKTELHRIFNRFYQGPNSKIGAGIGLSITKNWVEAHNGKIWAESLPLIQGTKISFSIPL